MSGAVVDCPADAFAFRLQMQELQSQIHLLEDARFAERLMLEALGGNGEEAELLHHLSAVDADAFAFQMQLELLQAAAAEADNHQQAQIYAHAEGKPAADEAASAALIQAIAEQDAWEMRLRLHDRLLAQRIEDLSDDEWEEMGENVQMPIKLSPRPVVPEQVEVDCTSTCPALCIAQTAGKPHATLGKASTSSHSKRADTDSSGDSQCAIYSDGSSNSQGCKGKGQAARGGQRYGKQSQ